MRKEENTEKDELYGKLQVHFIENVEAEESSEEKESDSGNLSDETARKSVSAEKENRAKKPVQKDIEEASAKSKGKKSETQSDSSQTDSEDDVKEQKGSRKRRHSKVDKQEAEAVEESFYKVTGEAEEHKSHPVRNAILGLLVLILVASAVVSYPIGKEYFQEKSVAGKDIEITIEKGSTSRDVSAILKKKSKNISEHSSEKTSEKYPENDFNEYSAEIGYSVLKKWQQQGIASEILPPLIHFGKEYLGFTKIVTRIEKNNIASIRLAKKNNLKILICQATEQTNS